MPTALAGILGGLANAAIKAVAQAVAKAASSLLAAIFSAIGQATSIDPLAPWFSGGQGSPVGLVAGIAGMVLALLFLLQMARSLLRQEGAGFQVARGMPQWSRPVAEAETRWTGPRGA